MEVAHKAVKEARRWKVEEAKCRAEKAVEAATRRQISLFGDWRRLLADQAGQAGG